MPYSIALRVQMLFTITSCRKRHVRPHLRCRKFRFERSGAKRKQKHSIIMTSLSQMYEPPLMLSMPVPQPLSQITSASVRITLSSCSVSIIIVAFDMWLETDMWHLLVMHVYTLPFVGHFNSLSAWEHWSQKNQSNLELL